VDPNPDPEHWAISAEQSMIQSNKFTKF
jgi:hypothetical protein